MTPKRWGPASPVGYEWLSAAPAILALAVMHATRHRLHLAASPDSHPAPPAISSSKDTRSEAVVNDIVSVGGRLATGARDDPNSTDVQLANFDDDLQFSLDQAYFQINIGNLRLVGGKLPQPFVRTDRVWDCDVNPQGIGAPGRLRHECNPTMEIRFAVCILQLQAPQRGWRRQRGFSLESAQPGRQPCLRPRTRGCCLRGDLERCGRLSPRQSEVPS